MAIASIKQAKKQKTPDKFQQGIFPATSSEISVPVSRLSCGNYPSSLILPSLLRAIIASINKTKSFPSRLCRRKRAAQMRQGWQNRVFDCTQRPSARNSPMQMTTALLIVNPCDDEEDNMAMLCCHSDKGDMFLMSRYPDEDELEITLDGEPSTLDGVKVTLSKTLLKIEIAAADADALNGDDVLEISFNPDMVDLDEVVETLKNILDGTGTFINEV
jgi:hypothetical protein